MQPRRLVFSLLILGMGALLAACTTPTDGLLAEQGFGHFAANSVNIDLDPPPPPSGFTAQVIDPSTSAQAIFVDGLARGIGSDDYTLKMVASGPSVVSCTNQGQHKAPGQNPVFVSDSDGDLDFSSAGNKGQFPFDVNNGGALSEDSVAAFLTSFPFPCPNPNWTLRLDWIDWTHIDLFLFDPADVDQTDPTDELHYDCITNRAAATIACTRVPDNHDE